MLLLPPSRAQLRQTAYVATDAAATNRANAQAPRGSPANSSASIAHEATMP